MKVMANTRELRVWVTLDCSNCDGGGVVSIGPECDKPASMCCGGCFVDEACEDCDGIGKVVFTLDAEKIGDIVNSLYNSDINAAIDLLMENKE